LHESRITEALHLLTHEKPITYFILKIIHHGFFSQYMTCYQNSACWFIDNYGILVSVVLPKITVQNKQNKT